MYRIANFGCLVALCVAGTLCHANEPANPDYPNASLLMEPAKLQRRLNAVVILDVRSKADFNAGHIPGARHVDHGDWKGAFDGQNHKLWTKRFGELGIDGEKTVVVYDDAAGKNASRIWWILRYYGAKDVRLLNGFWHEWKTKKLPITTKVAKPKAVTFKGERQQELLATKDELLASLAGQEPTFQIVDARSFDEHCGKASLGNPRAGHIPGAKLLNWEKVVDTKKTHRFRPAPELAKLFADAGIDLSKPTATHCQSGGRAAVMVFTMELMGSQNVANYYNSFGEWAKDAQAPVETKVPEKNVQD